MLSPSTTALAGYRPTWGSAPATEGTSGTSRGVRTLGRTVTPPTTPNHASCESVTVWKGSRAKMASDESDSPTASRWRRRHQASALAAGAPRRVRLGRSRSAPGFPRPGPGHARQSLDLRVNLPCRGGPEGARIPSRRRFRCARGAVLARVVGGGFEDPSREVGWVHVASAQDRGDAPPGEPLRILEDGGDAKRC